MPATVFCLAFGLMTVLLWAGCIPASSTFQTEPAMDPRFAKVPLNSTERNPCSPKAPHPNWTGILIDAPKTVVILPRQVPVVPLCGHYLLAGDVLAMSPDLVIVASQVGNNQAVFRKEAGTRDPSPDEPNPDEPSLSMEELAAVELGGYFNLELISLLGLPLQSADYTVHAELGGMKSNVIRLRLEFPPAPKS